MIRLKSLLEQSERHLQEEENRNRETSQQVVKLTEMKNLLQMDHGGGTGVDKQVSDKLQTLNRYLGIAFNLSRIENGYASVFTVHKGLLVSMCNFIKF